MTASEKIEAVLSETIAALSRLETDALEELERRAARIAESLGAEGLQVAESSREGLRPRVDLLEACLSATAENLAVLDRLRSRKVMA
jgi:hypothetical protein